MKNRVLTAGFFIAVVSLTVYIVLKDQDMGRLLEDIQSTNPIYVCMAVMCVIVCVYAESHIIRNMLAAAGIRQKRRDCFTTSCIGFFFSCITPSASGGQPAQLVHMKKKGVPVTVSSCILVMVTILYKSVLLIIGTGIIVFGQNLLTGYMKESAYIFYIGYFLNVVFVAGLILIIVKNSFVKSAGLFCVRILHKCHIIKNTEKACNAVISFSDRYKVDFGRISKKSTVIKAAVITFLQRVALFLVTWFVYKAYGLSGAGVIKVVVLQAMISISVDMLPLPGGSGISEYLFSIIFLPIFTEKLLIPGMIMSRGIAFYVQLFFCMVVTIAANVGEYVTNLFKKKIQ